METTILMSVRMKRGIKRVAKSIGQSAEEFMLKAVTDALFEHESYVEFHQQGLRRSKEYDRTGKSFSLVEFEKHLRDLVAQERTKKSTTGTKTLKVSKND